MLKNKKLLAAITLIILLIGVFFYRSYISTEKIDVRVVDLSNVIVDKTVSASGSVKSKTESNLSFSTPGELVVLSVKEGDFVKRGQSIAQLKNGDRFDTSETYKKAVDIARNERALFIRKYEKDKGLVGGSKAYDIQIQIYNDSVERAVAAYNASLSSINSTYMVAPTDGLVVGVFKNNGEFVMSGEPVVKIVDVENIYFETSLDQEDFGLIREGQLAAISLNSYPGSIVPGRVSFLPLYASQTNVSAPRFVVEVEILDTNGNPLLVGMDGDVRILLETSEHEVKALVFDSVFRDSGGHYIWVDNKGVLEKLPIEIGIEGDLYTEIKTPLDSYNIVVPLTEAKEGTQVNITN